MSAPGQRRILIVGGGFIGMYAARRLQRLTRTGHRVTLVNPENFMQYQPFLPEVASGTIDPRAVVVPLRQVLRKTELLRPCWPRFGCPTARCARSRTTS